MKLIEINLQPSDRQVRQFAFICAIVLPLLGWLWGGDTPLIATLAVVGAAVALAGLIKPSLVKPLFLTLTFLTAPIGMVVGEVAMLIIFFGVFCPIGLVFRIAKRDALKLSIDPAKKSYWEEKKSPAKVSSYFRQS